MSLIERLRATTRVDRIAELVLAAATGSDGRVTGSRTATRREWMR